MLVDTGYGLQDVAHPHARLPDSGRRSSISDCAEATPPCDRSRRSASPPATSATSSSPISTSTTPAGSRISRRPASTSWTRSATPRSASGGRFVARQRYRRRNGTTCATGEPMRRRRRALVRLRSRARSRRAAAGDPDGAAAGHTAGHAGVAIRGRELAASRRRRLSAPRPDGRRPPCPPGLTVYQSIMDTDRSARRTRLACARSRPIGAARSRSSVRTTPANSTASDEQEIARVHRLRCSAA